MIVIISVRPQTIEILANSQRPSVPVSSTTAAVVNPNMNNPKVPAQSILYFISFSLKLYSESCDNSAGEISRTVARASLVSKEHVPSFSAL